jgi:hypothetical protein
MMGCPRKKNTIDKVAYKQKRKRKENRASGGKQSMR